MKIRTLVIDDEDLARSIVTEYLRDEPDIEVLAECNNGFDAVKAVNQHRPDLIFLDVQMPKLNGFEVLELVGREVAVVFVTAYDQYAMQAFDAAAVDYLLKPFDLARFRDALSRVRQRLRGNLAMPEPTELGRQARPPEQFLNRIVVRDGAKVHIVPVEDLEFAEAQDDYVALRSAGSSYLKQQTISSLEQSLDPVHFVRVHRSYLLNINWISKLELITKDTRIARLKSGCDVPVSRAGYLRLKELMDMD
jgi:two-component system LytT family response regulator